MAAARRPRSKYLTCFYCNRRTSTRYDGHVRRFECPVCDATNYLDENGDITDPPAETTDPSTPRPIRYASAPAQRSSPPQQQQQQQQQHSTSASASVFCRTCLKNQHLFTASLAQYLPDDPDDPDYAERERSYYRFRRQLERRYPQICAECEPRVRARMNRAAYTAKADMLRRMIDRTAANRRVRRRGLLDAVDVVGRWGWVAGLVLQLVWHVAVLGALVTASVGVLDLDQDLFGVRRLQLLLQACGDHWIFSSLPAANPLIGWSVLAGISSAWWNPRLVQTVRGFTRHINGLPQWYTYQALTTILRLLFFWQIIPSLPSSEPSELAIQVVAHLCGLGFTAFIYSAGPRSIKTDTAPLFGSSPSSPSPGLTGPHTDEDDDNNESKSMGQLLDEIANAPPAPATSLDDEFPPFQTTGRTTSSALQNHVASGRHQQSQQQQYHQQNQQHQQLPLLQQSEPDIQQALDLRYAAPPSSSSPPLPPPASSFSSLSSFPSSPPLPPPMDPPIQYSEEMDWSPTQSKHRAFSTYGQQRKLRFGETPTEPRKGPFWYHVPPAPTSPAQRLFNPPNQPRLRHSPSNLKQQQQDIFFRGGGSSTATATAHNAGGVVTRRPETETETEAETETTGRQVPFAEPSFFAAAAAQSDPRNSLSDMFGQSFNLSQEEQERRKGWLGGSLLGFMSGSGSGKKSSGSSNK